MCRSASSSAESAIRCVPAAARGGGWIDSAFRYFGRPRVRSKPSPRGMWLVRAGLFWYDRLSGESQLPRSRVLRRDPALHAAFAPQIRWFCAYHDAQMPYPEQFTAALLNDTFAAAGDERRFRLHTYARATARGRALRVEPADACGPAVEYEPAAVVNAGGPWGDRAHRSNQSDET